ncbi:hypothetical protein H1R20_g15132, partial [Candolleomyces eurysporus]
MSPPLLPSKRPAESTGSADHSAKKTKRESRVQELEEELRLLKEKILLASEHVEDWHQKNPSPNDKDVIWHWKLFLKIGSPDEAHSRLLMSRRLQSNAGVATLTNTLLDAYSVVWNKLGAAKAPSPSDFAMKEVWPEHQKRSPILCLRPSTAIGLPLCVLWDGFRTFIVNTSDPNTIPSPAGRQAGASLCETMGNSFESEDERSSVIDASLEPVVPNWRSQYRVEPYAGIVLGQIDRVLPLRIVREDRWESTTTQSDIYMQTSRSYELLVQELRSKGMRIPPHY